MLYDYIFYFLLYAFFGWCAEVVFAAVKTGSFVNRGFLNGPVCPIYGAGVSVVAFCLTPVCGNIIVLFIGSTLLTTGLEFVTGYVLEKVYNTKWWDYSERTFNIKGYICLEFSLIWGLACTVTMRVIHPMIMRLVNVIPYRVGVVAETVLLMLLAADFVITVAEMRKITVASGILDKLSVDLRELSDKLGEEIYKGVTDAKEFKQLIEEKTVIDDIIKDKLAEIRTKMNKYTKSAEITRGRLLKAFPNLKNTRQHTAYERAKQLREKLNKDKNV